MLGGWQPEVEQQQMPRETEKMGSHASETLRGDWQGHMERACHVLPKNRAQTRKLVFISNVGHVFPKTGLWVGLWKKQGGQGLGVSVPWLLRQWHTCSVPWLSLPPNQALLQHQPWQPHPFPDDVPEPASWLQAWTQPFIGPSLNGRMTHAKQPLAFL